MLISLRVDVVMTCGYFLSQRKCCLISLMVFKYLRKLNLSVPLTCIKVDNSGALRTLLKIFFIIWCIT